MNSLKVTKEVWHFKVARYGGLRQNSTDICQYTRRFILGCLALLLIGALGCLVVTPIVVIASFSFIRLYPPIVIAVSQIVCGVYAIGILGIGIFFGIRKIINLCKETARQAKFKAIANGTYVPKEEKPPKPPKEPGMLHEMYKAYKRKYCVKIEIR